MMLVISINMMATCTPWKNFTRPPLTFPAATAKIAPTRIGQHQLPMSAGTAAHNVHTATKMEPLSASGLAGLLAGLSGDEEAAGNGFPFSGSGEVSASLSESLPQSRHSSSGVTF